MSLDHNQVQTGESEDHKNVRVAGYVFTWNNPDFDEEALETKLRLAGATAYAFQHETGKECGTPHF